MFLFYVLSFFKEGDTIQGGTLIKGGHLRKYGILQFLFKLIENFWDLKFWIWGISHFRVEPMFDQALQNVKDLESRESYNWQK